MAYDVLVVGGGIAGLTAALYTCRAGKTVLVLEKENPGGQINWSPCVENYPGLAHVSGSEISDRLLAQVLDQGGEVELEEVTGIEDGRVKKIRTASGTVYEGYSLIAAAGALPRKLNLPEEEKYIGNGECFCALCDGAFYAQAPVAVCGGGNAALQDALYLSDTCSRVYLIHRRSQFRGEAKLVELLKKKSNVEFVLNSRIAGLYGEESLEGITVEDAEGGKNHLPWTASSLPSGEFRTTEYSRRFLTSMNPDTLLRERTAKPPYRGSLPPATDGGKPYGSW